MSLDRLPTAGQKGSYRLEEVNSFHRANLHVTTDS